MAPSLTKESEGNVVRYPSQEVRHTEIATMTVVKIDCIFNFFIIFVFCINNYNPISIPNVTLLKVGNANVGIPLIGCSGSTFL